MPVQITPLKDDVPYVNLLVYADSGAGKTVLAGSDYKVLFMAPEDSGLLSSLRLGSKADKIKVKTWPDLMAAYDYLYDHPEILAKYDWLCVDSLTEMQGMCLRYIVSSQRQDRLNKDQDPDQPQIQDYGKLYILMEKFVLAFNDLPVNTFYTALSRAAEDSDGNDFILPMLGSSEPKKYHVAMKIAAHMTSYGYLKVQVVDLPAPTEAEPNKVRKIKQRVVIWEDTGTIRGKDRTTRLAPKTVLPPRLALRTIRGLINGDGLAQKQAPPAKAPAKKPEPPKDKLARNDSDPISAVNDVPPAPEQEDVIELDSIEA